MALTGIVPLVWWVAGTFFPAGKGAVQVLLLACPPCGLGLATDIFYGTASGVRSYWAFVGVQLGMVVLALTIAGRQAPRIWTEGEETPVRGHNALWRWCRLGSAAMQRRRRKWIEVNPFFWLASRDRLSLAVAWGIVGVLFAIWAVFYAGSFAAAGTKREVCFTIAAFMAYGAFVLGKSMVAIEAARRISEDRQNGTLELLLVTPLEVEQLIAGQRRALHRIFLGPGLVVVVMNVGLIAAVADFNRGGGGHSVVGVCCFFFAVGGLFLKGDVTALSYAGMWIGLRGRRLQREVLEMLGRVMLVPWVGVAFFAVTLILGAGLSAAEMFLLLFGWVLLSLFTDAFAGARARGRLDREFRHAACGDRRPPTETTGEAVAEPYGLFRSA
jgi:hypothetical protein